MYQWFPKTFGRMLDKKLGYVHFWLTFLGVYLTFMSMHYLGIAGFPRRYYSWSAFDAFSQFADLSKFISLAAIAVFFAQFIFLFNVFYSIFRGRLAT